MIKARTLNDKGLTAFLHWLEAPIGATPPAGLIDNEELSGPCEEFQIDPDRLFGSRFELGTYLNEQFATGDFDRLVSPEFDGLWAWLAVVYFRQLAPVKIRRSEHYIVTRKGAAGSLAYRHAVRTSFELAHIHGKSAWICLKGPMHTFGELTEQLASRQTIAHNRGFFQTAYELYVEGGEMKRGASSKPKKPKERKLGDRTGFGSVRRLAIALQRLDLTYDTDDMGTSVMKSVLPREFAKWSAT